MHGNSDVDDGPTPATLELVDHLRPLSMVRRWVRDALSGVTEDELEDCLLVVNELMSNAFDHGRSPRRLRLYRSAQPCFVRIEVDDASLDQPVLGRSRLGGNRGRGMIIVNRLAKDWGVTPAEEGKTVWAEITCDG